MSERPTFPLVPQVDYPIDYETDKELRDQLHMAIQADDPRCEAELRLALAHRDMVRRDAALRQLVEFAQRGDGDGVLLTADLHAFWQTAMDREVQLAAADRRRLADREAGR